jgi:hypothetical protein
MMESEVGNNRLCICLMLKERQYVNDAAHNLALSGPEYFELMFFDLERPSHKRIARTLLYTRPQFTSIEDPGIYYVYRNIS